MIEEIQRMMDGYLGWLREKTSLREIGDWIEITTPLLDRHNDYLQIYVRREDGHFILTDDGYTLQDLEQSGCKLDSPKRQELLRMTLNGFGVQVHDAALEVRATEDNFPLRKHSLLQAMLGVNDLFYLAAPHTASLFYEDVVTWMSLNDIRFVENAKFTGKTGYDHLFEFVIPRSRRSPERFVKPINRPDKSAAMEMVFAWMDTRETRPPESRAYALLNDAEREVKADVTDAFLNYDIKPVRWSKRESVRNELAS
ncbi:MAG TPA: DUF1829 domain-containing protein [Acidobacteriaceae bacterium]|nr:DUF1829 domain-containing protein [Acidobacteriaceae bacterium]